MLISQQKKLSSSKKCEKFCYSFASLIAFTSSDCLELRRKAIDELRNKHAFFSFNLEVSKRESASHDGTQKTSRIVAIHSLVSL